MTWSIVAREASGALGVIVASRFFAVGALCPHAHSGIGALSTQALVNPLYGPRGLAWLAQGIAPAEVVRSLILADAGREHRQVHLIDAEGKIAEVTIWWRPLPSGVEMQRNLANALGMQPWELRTNGE